MSANYLWSTYGLEGPGDDWDLAATPSYNGTTTAAFNADTFRIHKDTKHPDEAFEVLTYLLGEASSTLLTTYGGMPARTEEQDAFFTTSGRDFTHEVDWKVAKDASSTPTMPTSSRTCRRTTRPSARQADRVRNQVADHRGPQHDTEVEDARAEIQAIWDKEWLTTPGDGRPRPSTPVACTASPARVGWRAARGPVGLRLHLAVDHRVPRLHAGPDDRHARLHVHQHQPGPGGAAPVRRPAQLREAARRPDGGSR